MMGGADGASGKRGKKKRNLRKRAVSESSEEGSPVVRAVAASRSAAVTPAARRATIRSKQRSRQRGERGGRRDKASGAVKSAGRSGGGIGLAHLEDDGDEDAAVDVVATGKRKRVAAPVPEFAAADTPSVTPGATPASTGRYSAAALRELAAAQSWRTPTPRAEGGEADDVAPATGDVPAASGESGALAAGEASKGASTAGANRSVAASLRGDVEMDGVAVNLSGQLQAAGDDADDSDGELAERARAAREQRQRRRAGSSRASKEGLGSSDDFVPLSGRGSGVRAPPIAASMGDEGAIVRDFAGNVHRRRADGTLERLPSEKAAQRLSATAGGGTSASGAKDDDMEPEVAEWEVEQIRRGGRGTEPQQLASAARASAASATARRAAALPPIGVEEMLDRLGGAAGVAQSRVETHESELTRLEGTLSELRLSVEKRKAELDVLAPKYDLFRECRSYVRDLAGCLKVKVPMVAALETAMDDEGAKHLDIVARTRMADLCDELDEAKLAGATVVRLLGRQPDDAPHASVRQDKPSRWSARVARRTKAGGSGGRTRVGLPRGAGEALEAEASALSSEESDSESVRTRTRSAELDKARGLLFADVVDAFRRIPLVIGRFAAWKRGPQRDSYVKAFVSMSIPGLLAPLVRHELLSWNPLTDHDPAFDERFQWFRDLWEFTMPEDEASEGHEVTEEEPDERLIPNLMSTVVATRVAAALRRRWDVLSTRQTACATAVVRELGVYEPPDDVMRGVAAAAMERISAAAAALCVPIVRLPHEASAAGADHGGSPGWLAPVSWRQVVLAVKLLRNACACEEFVSTAALAPLVLGDQLLGGLLAPVVEALLEWAAEATCSAEQRASLGVLLHSLVTALPDSWRRAATAPHEGLAALRHWVEAALALPGGERDAALLDARDALETA